MNFTGLGQRLAVSAALDDCQRRSLACQLACIACVDAGLRATAIERHSALIRACFRCLDTCMVLGNVILTRRARGEALVPYLQGCVDACATCEAECRELVGHDLLARRCALACAELGKRCRLSLTLDRAASASD